MATSRNYSQPVIAASDEIKDIFCEPCVGDGKQVEAEGFCVDCSEYLCGQCYNSHGRFKAFKQHVLQDKKSMPIDVESTDVLDVCVEKCSEHPAKVTEFFCWSCDVLGCSDCITTNHCQCQDVDHIPDIVEDIENSEEFVEFEEEVIGKLKDMEENISMKHSEKNDANEMRKQAKVELKMHRDEINKFFDNLEAEMEEKITAMDKNVDDQIKAKLDIRIYFNDELNKIKTTLETKKKNGQKCELFIAMKQLEAKMENLDHQFEMICIAERKIQRYKLVQSTQIEEMMKNTTEMCKISTAKFVSKIVVTSDSVNQTSDGLAVVLGHFLAVAYNNNAALVIIDTRDGSVTSEMSLNCEDVHNVANVKDDHIVVLVSSSTPPSDKVLFLRVSASGTLSKSKVITSKRPSCDIVGTSQFLYLLHLDKISVIDMQGKVWKVIELGYPLLDASMAVNHDHDIIYLSDHDRNSVTSMTLDGKVIAVYKDEDLTEPTGITVDKDGFVYVLSSANIHQLTKDCIKVQILIEDVYGTTITYSDADNALYVGVGDKVKVYKLT